MAALKKTLGPFEAFTDTISVEDYVSVSYLKPVPHLLIVELLNLNDDTELTKQ